MLARLDWELEQRKRLTHQLEVATSEKQKVLEDIESKQKFLSSLQPQLDVILKATLPVQEQMGMLFERTRTQHNLALYLPESLYVLFVQARAYQEALDENLTVSIEGDVEVAKVFISRSSPEVNEEGESDSDHEEQQSQKRKKRRRTVDQALLDKQDNMMKIHPLSVRFLVKCNGITIFV
jgi:THO complex subunit 5